MKEVSGPANVCTCSCNGCNDGHHCGISRDGCGK